MVTTLALRSNVRARIVGGRVIRGLDTGRGRPQVHRAATRSAPIESARFTHRVASLLASRGLSNRVHLRRAGRLERADRSDHAATSAYIASNTLRNRNQIS
jgi:hypothetical protein